MEIALAYSRSHELWWDVAASLPLELVVMAAAPDGAAWGSARFTYFYRFNRLLRCWRLPVLWEELRNFAAKLFKLNAGYMRIGALGFFFLYFSHLLGVRTRAVYHSMWSRHLTRNTQYAVYLF